MSTEPIDYSKQPCHSQACAIQNCLQRNSYNESKCTYYIDQLYICCSKFYRERENPEETTVSCPIPRLLELKIQQRMDDGNVDAKLIEINKENKK